MAEANEDTTAVLTPPTKAQLVEFTKQLRERKDNGGKHPATVSKLIVSLQNSTEEIRKGLCNTLPPEIVDACDVNAAMEHWKTVAEAEIPEPGAAAPAAGAEVQAVQDWVAAGASQAEPSLDEVQSVTTDNRESPDIQFANTGQPWRNEGAYATQGHWQGGLHGDPRSDADRDNAAIARYRNQFLASVWSTILQKPVDIAKLTVELQIRLASTGFRDADRKAFLSLQWSDIDAARWSRKRRVGQVTHSPKEQLREFLDDFGRILPESTWTSVHEAMVEEVQSIAEAETSPLWEHFRLHLWEQLSAAVLQVSMAVLDDKQAAADGLTPHLRRLVARLPHFTTQALRRLAPTTPPATHGRPPDHSPWTQARHRPAVGGGAPYGPPTPSHRPPSRTPARVLLGPEFRKIADAGYCVSALLHPSRIPRNATPYGRLPTQEQRADPGKLGIPDLDIARVRRVIESEQDC